MKVRDLIAEGIKTLEQNQVPDSEYDIWRILALATRREMLSLHLLKEEEVNAEAAAKFFELVSKRAARVPLQYLEGETWFMELRFQVAPAVLIPRQDTEILCEEVLKRIPENAKVLDIGTGSGAIAVSLKKKRQDIAMTGVDISEEALQIARLNASSNQTEVTFKTSDCFSALQNERFDVIVSNPPYISEAEMHDLMPEVQCEPRTALYGGPDGLDFYRRIISEATDHLNPNGLLIFEIGWLEKDAVSSLMRDKIGEPFCIRDLNGNWRVVGAHLVNNVEEFA